MTATNDTAAAEANVTAKPKVVSAAKQYDDDRPALNEALANFSFVAKPHSMVAWSKVGHESHEWTRMACSSQIRVHSCDSWLVPWCEHGRRPLGTLMVSYIKALASIELLSFRRFTQPCAEPLGCYGAWLAFSFAMEN
ncbi:hypothetical protein SH528x_002950 [Novipirellula sp. SH528]|uniref:hypothetical protein n=1 Tax=Novipirellula sp. SH528 TaxID=3454466 RepID=UPI003FA06C60